MDCTGVLVEELLDGPLGAVGFGEGDALGVAGAGVGLGAGGAAGLAAGEGTRAGDGIA